MHLSLRSRSLAPEGGVRHRARHRTVRRTQPRPAASARSAGVGRPATGQLPRGGSPGRRSTVVRRADARRHCAGGLRRSAGRSCSGHAAHGEPGTHSTTVHEHTFARPGLVIRFVTFYQRAVEGRPSPCRFTPSCSAYAVEALEVHGTARGLVLTARRLLRCRPFGPSGWDPVPDVSSRKRAAT